LIKESEKEMQQKSVNSIRSKLKILYMTEKNCCYYFGNILMVSAGFMEQIRSRFIK